MTTTANYGLQKPGLNDPVDIEVLNKNFDTIDEKLKEAAETGNGTGATAEQLAQIQANADAIADLPIAVEDGYTYIGGLPQAVGINVVRDGNTVTITSTLEDGSTSTSVMTLDDNDYPTKVVTDGVECTLAFTGFEETTEESTESTETTETEAGDGEV